MLYKILKYPFFGNYMVKWKNPLSPEEMNNWKRVAVKSKSGGTIQGLFSETNAGRPRATIVLGHPMGKEAKGYFLKRGYADFLKNADYNVLVFDINGFGESSHGSFSYYEDIVAIGKKARELTPELPIGYHGISLGAMWSVVALTDESHPYTFAIIESAATTLDEFWKRFPTPYKVLRILNFLLPSYKGHIAMIERIKEVKHLNALLFIYSRDDAWVPFEMGERYLENSPIASELWSVENAKHAEIVKSKNREEYSVKIVSFFNQFSKRETTTPELHSPFYTLFRKELLASFENDMIKENGTPSVRYLADKMNVSPNYLSDLLRTTTGYGALTHIHLEVLKRSKDMILHSNKRISEVAYELGFEYPQHFSSFFKDKTGVSPLHFRNNPNNTFSSVKPNET